VSALALENRPTVLVAEDDEELRGLICDMLARAGCAVEAFPDGDSLSRALAHRLDDLGQPPDLIVTDVQMAGHSGLEVVRQLRRYDRVTPVIVVTAFGGDFASSKAEHLGAQLLEKPFDLEELKSVAAGLGVIP
jgi:DNA-binding response OmpR family regulator